MTLLDKILYGLTLIKLCTNMFEHFSLHFLCSMYDLIVSVKFLDAIELRKKKR